MEQSMLIKKSIVVQDFFQLQSTRANEPETHKSIIKSEIAFQANGYLVLIRTHFQLL